jgi:hypothetical protein
MGTDPFQADSARTEVRERVLVLRRKADRAREEAQQSRTAADALDELADKYDTVADQYLALVGSTPERPLFDDVHVTLSHSAPAHPNYDPHFPG